MFLGAGYSVVLVNTTRLCETYVPAGCNEQCIVATVDAMLAARAGPTSRSQSQQLVATVVPAVVVPVGRWQCVRSVVLAVLGIDLARHVSACVQLHGTVQAFHSFQVRS